MSAPYVVSIDAWRHGEGWTWNAWYKLTTLDAERAARCETPRRVTRLLRELGVLGVLGAQSAGRVRVYYDRACENGNIEIQDRHTGEPLYAICFDGAIE